MTPKKSSDFTNGPVFGPPLIGALLRAPWEAVRARMLERLHEQGYDDIDAPHLTLFLHPGPQGSRPSELAARVGMSKQAVNYLLGELERRGYLERRVDPLDQRSRRIALTRRGERAGWIMRDAVDEIAGEWEARLGRERFAELEGLLRELAEQA